MHVKSSLRLCAPLMAALALCLLGCSSPSTRPELPPIAPSSAEKLGVEAVKPEPPRVDCKQEQPAPVAEHPRTEDQQAWEIWAIRVYGHIRAWVDRDVREVTCLEDLKAKGVIQ